MFWANICAGQIIRDKKVDICFSEKNMNDFADYILRNTLWMNNNNNNDAIEWSVTAIFIDYKDKQQITGYYDKTSQGKLKNVHWTFTIIQ